MANRQEIVCTYIYDNYVQFDRLQHDVISNKLVSWGNIKKPMPLNRLGMLLKKAGYRDVRRGEQRTRGWIVYERTLDEVNANRNKKNRPADQMTSCFLKLYTPTRVCEIIIRNWSAGQLVSPNKPDDIRRNGHRKRETRSRNSRAQDTEGRRGSRNDARKMHREKPAFNAGEWKKGKRGIPRGTEHTKKGRAVDVRNANEMRTVEEANKRLINQ